MAKPKDIQLADELERLMDEREAIEAAFEEQLTPLKEKEEKIRTDLRDYLVKIGRDFTRTSSGMSFGLVKGRVTWGVKKGIGTLHDAVKWVLANDLESVLAISSPALTKVFEGKFVGTKISRKIPDYFERKESEPHLQIRTSEDEAVLKPQHG